MCAERLIRRRDFIASGLVALGAIAVGPGVWSRALAAPTVGEGPYGPLGAPDANGILLPRGFTSRVVARSGQPVSNTSHVWHDAPDGGATFKSADGGWIYVSNSEVGGRGGGVGAVRFGADGRVVDAYPILQETSVNCSGGPTPWNTWLSCEEFDRGRVWECDPSGGRAAVVLDAMGVFKHEAAAVDPVHRRVYLTEDEGDGVFYRFIPSRYPALDDGSLEVAEVAADGRTRWHPVPDPSARSRPTRAQVASATRFDGGEGAWYDAGVVYFTTKGDNRVWSYDTRIDRMSLLYEARSVADAPLVGVDNVTVSALSGDVFVAEDGGDLDLVLITPDETVARFLKVTGRDHRGSELAGPAMDPSGTRLYFSSQRGFGRGVTYEVRGPFRNTRVTPPASRSPRPLPVDDGGPSRTAQAGAIAGGAVAVAAAAAALRRRLRRG